MPLRVGERILLFAQEKIPAILGTIRRDGSVQMNPVWFEYADGYVWLNGGPDRRWFHHIKRDPQQRLTLLLIDPSNMWRWAQVQGRMVEATEHGADEHIDRLSHRYLGRPYQRRPGERCIMIKIEPLRVTGFDGGRPWD